MGICVYMYTRMSVNIYIYIYILHVYMYICIYSPMMLAGIKLFDSSQDSVRVLQSSGHPPPWLSLKPFQTSTGYVVSEEYLLHSNHGAVIGSFVEKRMFLLKNTLKLLGFW